MIVDNTSKTYEKPDSGLFVGVLADIVYFKDKPTKFGPKNTARLIWVLNAKGKDGNYYHVMTEATQSLNEKARLYTLAKDIRNGTPPPVPFELDELIGSVNGLVITREKSPDGTKDYANVKAIIPNSTGQSFAVPKDFVRHKDRKSGQSTAASATSSAPAQAASADNSSEIDF